MPSASYASCVSAAPYRIATPQPPVKYLAWSFIRRLRRIMAGVVFGVIHVFALTVALAAWTSIPVRILAICVMFANAVAFNIATGTRSRPNRLRRASSIGRVSQ
jgi:hypothetical protein